METKARWHVVAMPNRDAYALYIHRYEYDPEMTACRAWNLNADGEWVEYIEYDEVEPHLVVSGYVLYLLNPADRVDVKDVAKRLADAIREHLA